MEFSDPNPVYVVGHLNPDTDAICSAIGHAEYLRQSGYKKAQAIRCGEVPERTEWVLKQAGIPSPELVEDVRATAGMLVKEQSPSVKSTDTFLSAYRVMVETQLRSLPIVNDKGEVTGLLKFTELLQLLMHSQEDGETVRTRTVFACLANAVETLEAKSIGSELPPACVEKEYLMLVAASSHDSLVERLQKATQEGNISRGITICGDRPDVWKTAIELGVACLIVTGGFPIDSSLTDLAKENGVVVISTENDTASSIQLVRCSRMVASASSGNCIVVEEDEAISDLKEKLTTSQQDLFPVVKTSTREFIGVFSKSALISIPRNRLVLVDHNEYSQAVKGVEEAEVIEVLDHHRLGGNVTSTEPIVYHNEPVGSTCTLVARKFKNTVNHPSKGIALCLCAGIISDTLNLTSPTTTDVDRSILKWLCEIAGIDAVQFTKDFFAAGSLLLHGKPKEIIGTDRKEFLESGVKVSISQVEEVGLDALDERKAEIQEEMQSMIDTFDYDIVLVAVTDITEKRSVILVKGNAKIEAALPFEKIVDGEWDAPGVVSRKKQIFPGVCHAISNSATVELEAGE